MKWLKSYEDESERVLSLGQFMVFLLPPYWEVFLSPLAKLRRSPLGLEGGIVQQ